MYYLVYKVTNLINGKEYIGAHKTEDKDDEYLGSGKAIINAVKKYGRSSFKKEILFELCSSEEMFKKEKQLVSVGVNSYNIKGGGRGGWSSTGDEWLKKCRDAGIYSNSLLTNEERRLRGYKGAIKTNSKMTSLERKNRARLGAIAVNSKRTKEERQRIARLGGMSHLEKRKVDREA